MPDDIDVASRLTVLHELGYEPDPEDSDGLTLFRSQINDEDRLVVDLRRPTVPLEDFRGNLEQNGADPATINAALEQLWPSSK